jgi:symplekin
MDASVQALVHELVTPLVRSLGPGHGKLLTELRGFPPGAEALALRVLHIFTEHGRPGAPLVALVKGLVAERELDVRFLMPIIAEMDKVRVAPWRGWSGRAAERAQAEIMRHLPKVVGTLDGSAENKALVRAVFGSVVAHPAATLAATTSNQPRVRQSELLTPAELMVFLHESDKDIGLKQTIEGARLPSVRWNRVCS